MESERKDALKKKEEGFDAIGDDEKGPSTTDNSEAIQMPGAKVLGKRRATESDLIELDKDGEITGAIA